MENFRGVKWHYSPLAFGILVDHVAATLARYRKTQFFQYGSDFAGSQPWELWTLDSNFNSGEAHGNLGNLLAVGETVSNM